MTTPRATPVVHLPVRREGFLSPLCSERHGPTDRHTFASRAEEVTCLVCLKYAYGHAMSDPQLRPQVRRFLGRLTRGGQ